jgi:hypothetical protein
MSTKSEDTVAAFVVIAIVAVLALVALFSVADNIDIGFILSIIAGLGISSAIGAACAGKGNEGQGALLGLLLGPIGIIIAIIIGCTSNKTNDDAVAAYIAATKATQAATAPAVAPVAPAPAKTPAWDTMPENVYIKRDGEIIGQWPIASIIGFIALGNIVETDQYLDRAGQWRSIARVM